MALSSSTSLHNANTADFVIGTFMARCRFMTVLTRWLMVEAYRIPYKRSQVDFIEIAQPIDPPSEKIMLQYAYLDCAGTMHVTLPKPKVVKTIYVTVYIVTSDMSWREIWLMGLSNVGVDSSVLYMRLSSFSFQLVVWGYWMNTFQKPALYVLHFKD
jgi:hypothetical protein